ncbi:MAG: hypothetical protein IJ025_01245 [Clostridia bacterium]|nr:hypothetical protein [Clostridia bacterium]
MKKITLKKKILLSVCAVVLVAAIVAAVVFSGSFSTDEIKNYSYVAESQKGSDDLSGCDVFVQGDGNTKLAIDSKTAGMALVCDNGKTIFNSRSVDAAKNSLASVLNVRLRDKTGNSYTLNSTENCADFGTFEVKSENKKSASVTFSLFPDEKQAEKGVESAGVFARITVDFKYDDGGFVCSVDTSSVLLPEDFFIEKLSLLPGFFSVSEAFGDEFYTVPDGCGAVIDLSSFSEKPLTLNMSMYGSDVTFNEYSQGAVLPFFAMSKNGCLVNTVISDGDALAEISCEKHSEGGGYLYNTFNVTACGMVDGKLRMGETYKGIVSQTYYVTENKKADYNNIARQVRDSLISRGYLPREISDKFIDLPFFINVLGSADGKNPSTTFEDAAEITALLESRGVRNVALRFSGAGKKGLASDADELSFDSDLGGKDGFSNMLTKVTDNGNSVWLDINLCTERSGSSGVKTAVYELPSKVAGFKVQKFSLTSTKEVNSDISEAYKLMTDYKNTDVCINDAAQLLYTDLQGGLNRQQVLENMKEKMSSLSVNGDVMLSYPAVYLMGETDAVFNVPETASCGGNEGVTEIPVLQMVLHGSVIYGGNYINVTNLSQEDALLKNIEYGSVPSFLFTHESSSNLNYNIYATQTSELYSDAKALLPVMDMKITSHEKVVSGVYKTTYDYNKVVYVNYNPSVVEVNGIMISAKDYVVI